MKNSGKLYLVATPIGNLEDITLRAIKILGSVDILLCEDTRHTGLLLKRHHIKKPKLVSYREFNEQQRVPEIISLLKNGANVALVSDAGTPLVSDPGYKLVSECLKRKMTIIPIPGPTAIITALVVSGFPANNFYFRGYLPKQKGKRQTILKSLPSQTTIVCYETPHRLIETLNDISTIYKDIPIVICRELTKMHEEIFRGTAAQALNHFKKPKGEFVLVFFKS